MSEWLLTATETDNFLIVKHFLAADHGDAFLITPLGNRCIKGALRKLYCFRNICNQT